MNNSLIQISAWTAYVNAALSIAGTATLILFFVAGGFWGPLNDSFSVLWALSFLPLLATLYQINAPVNPPLALVAVLVGVASMLAFAFLQILLVMRVVRFEQTFVAVTSLGAALGLAIFLTGLLVRQGSTFPARLAWISMAFGLSFMVSGVGFGIGGWENPLAGAGYLISVFTGPVWAFWLGRLLVKSQSPVTANI
jgi:hypothetical protein